MSNYNTIQYEKMLSDSGMSKREAATWASKITKTENEKREKKIQSILEVSGGDIELINEAVKKVGGYKVKLATNTDAAEVTEPSVSNKDIESFVKEYITHSIGLNRSTFSILDLLKVGREKGFVTPITDKRSSMPISNVIKAMVTAGRVTPTSSKGRCFTYKIMQTDTSTTATL